MKFDFLEKIVSSLDRYFAPYNQIQTQTSWFRVYCVKWRKGEREEERESGRGRNTQGEERWCCLDLRVLIYYTMLLR